MIRLFIDWNINICRRIDKTFYKKKSRVLLDSFLNQLTSIDIVADVGGGKKPVIGIITDGKYQVSQYDGFDIDIEELEQVRNLYSNIHTIDLTKSVDHHRNKYSKILCKSTLEHVLDDTTAFRNLSEMLVEGGELYVSVPCRLAIFTILNRALPNNLKRRILHFIFPEKIGDGFPAYYKGCSISNMERNATLCNMEMQSYNKNMTSSYFMFFIPFYVAWRIITVIQILTIKDYCESFEAVFIKQP